jgi:hypothetical protein
METDESGSCSSVDEDVDEDHFQEGKSVSASYVLSTVSRFASCGRCCRYGVMMMTTIDDTFSVEVPPWSEQRGKKGLKPNLALYRRELRRRDPKVRVPNR